MRLDLICDPALAKIYDDRTQDGLQLKSIEDLQDNALIDSASKTKSNSCNITSTFDLVKRLLNVLPMSSGPHWIKIPSNRIFPGNQLWNNFEQV